MKPVLTLPFMNAQPVSPQDLLAKLSNIKSANETSNMKLKEIREVEQKMTFYETYCTDIINTFQGKMTALNKEVTELKKIFKKTQNLGVINFDKVQKMLENTLDQYERDRKKGQQMIEKMVAQIQEKLQKFVLQKSMQSSQLCEQYLKLNNRLESVIESLESMESQLISQYSKLRTEMNDRFLRLQRSILSEMQNTDKNTQALLKKISKLEEQCQIQIDKIIEKKEQKRYQLHEIMEKMIQDAVNNDQDI